MKLRTAMKAAKDIVLYKKMRSQPLWCLLATPNAPITIALLQSHLYDTDRILPSSILHERIERDLEELRANGEDLPQTAQCYIANWLLNGFLERRLPQGANEEIYELSTATVEAIRFVGSIELPHSAATESRLALVITSLIKLAEDTDLDQARRIGSLLKERERIDKGLDKAVSGQFLVLPEMVALERTREIINLSDELVGDFRRVRDQFEHLNSDLRRQLMGDIDNRGEILDAMFSGIDLIADSEAGRTFAAFWRLLTDPEQAFSLEKALDQIMSRDFSKQLSLAERKFLLRLTRTLLEQGGLVHEVLQNFARSLKTFVKSREYLEQQRLNQLLKSAQRTALAIKNDVKFTEALSYMLELTSCKFKSCAQWVLFDPQLRALPRDMEYGEQLQIELHMVSELVAQSEIDFRSLKANIRVVLQQHMQASVGEVLKHFPALQGLGSVLGLLALGSRHGVKTDITENVSWIGADNLFRQAKIPKIFFIKERIHELQ